MKKLFTLSCALFLTVLMFAQSPEKLTYQAVVRNSGNSLVASVSVGMRISVLQGSASGTAVYVETQTTTTNVNGLATIQIGGGTPVTGTFAAINWSNGPYFIKTETDPAGGTSYTITGTSQLLSVPYALFAKNAAAYTETDPIFTAWNKSAGISITSSQVTDFQTSVTNNAAMVANTAKVTNATHTGDATGATALTVVKINGTSLAGLATGLLKNTTGTGVPSIAVAGTDYLAPTSPAAAFPVLNQNTTGNAATVTTNANLLGDVTSVGNTTAIANKVTMTATSPLAVTGTPTVIASGAVAISIAPATATTPGSMSAADKVKLDGLAGGHYLGQILNGGIVFNIYKDNLGAEHGLIVSLTEQADLAWSTAPDLAGTRTWDGAFNMTVISAATSPAATYAASIGAGWYWPSIDELSLLYNARYYVNKAISASGTGTLIGYGDYWSSSEFDGSQALDFFFKEARAYAGQKTLSAIVRTIRAF